MSMDAVNSLAAAVLVFFVAFLSYISSLDCGFVFDDHRAILSNNDLDPTKTTLLEVFQHDFWGGSMSRKESHKSYRPFTVLTYRYLNYYFSQLEPYSYHVVNVLLHCTASVLFLLVCQKFISSHPTKKQQPESLYKLLLRDRWSIIAALLFAVHSIHTEAVASIVGRAEVLSCIFFLLSLLSYLKAVVIINSGVHIPLVRTRWRWVAMCIAFSACSLLSKEQGVTVLGVCAGYDVFLNWDILWKVFPESSGHDRNRNTSNEQIVVNEMVHLTEADDKDTVSTRLLNGEVEKVGKLHSSVSTNGKQKKVEVHNSPQVRTIMMRVVLLAVSGMLLLWFRLAMNYNSEPIFKPYELRAAYHEDRSVRMFSFSNIYAINSWLLLSPSSLCCDWSLGSVPLVTTIIDAKNMWSLILYASLVVLVVHTLREKRNKLLVGMGLMLLLLPFVPASGLVFRVGFVVAERVLYMPSLGSCYLVTVGARTLSNTAHKLQQYLVYLFLLILILTMGLKTSQRNKDWKTDFKLFESGVKVMPTNVKLRSNYGLELKDRGHVEEARAQYKAAIAVDPDYGEAYFNYGNLLSDEGKFAEAAENFEKAVLYPQMYAKTLNNLATMYFRLGKYNEAEEKYLESLRATPDQASTYNNLGMNVDLEESMKMTQDQASTYNNLASLYGETKKYKKSEQMFKKALELNPTYVEAIFNLGTLYVQMGHWDDGERELKRALKLNPNHHGAMNNLKVAQHYKAKQNR